MTLPKKRKKATRKRGLDVGLDVGLDAQLEAAAKIGADLIRSRMAEPGMPAPIGDAVPVNGPGGTTAWSIGPASATTVIPPGAFVPSVFSTPADGDRGGRKDDSGKLRFTLFPIEALKPVLRVLEFGARKYAPGGWRRVEDAEERYRNALHRHFTEVLLGNDLDDGEGGTGESHYACVAVNALFLVGIREIRLAREKGTSG